MPDTFQSKIQWFKEHLSQARTSDRYRLKQRFKRLKQHANTTPKAWEAWTRAVEDSISTTNHQRTHLPPYRLDDTLPIFEKRTEIIEAIKSHQVVIVCGETGSGKTTQLPLLCLEAGRGVTGVIGHTQPRRIAARAIAQRIASEMGQSIGQAVGYQVRFNDKTSRDGYIKVMTDGILLAETHGDGWLSHYDTVIIDEAHERSLNIDFLLGFLKRLLQRRKDLKLIVTSATIDAARFSAFFDQAPVIEVSGRLYPVELRYRPMDEEKAQDQKSPSSIESDRLAVAIGQAVDEAVAEGEGDILVFLPGEREIREAAECLRKSHPPQTRILPLYARQSLDEQRAVFERSNARKIVLSTNVAETSLTVPGIRFVIDTGLARIKRYSHRQKVEQLRIEKIAQASANQRAGRCGRISAGICFRLYSDTDFALRPAYPDPEILRSSLAGVILKMKALKLGEIDHFDFIDPPRPNMITEGHRLLTEIGALESNRELTSIGQQISHLPLDPKIARILLAANELGCLTEMTIICAGLSVQDPRERPQEKREAADMAHRRFRDETSEAFDWIRLWRHVDEMIKHRKSNRKLVEQCRKEFLSYLRLREWRDVHGQLEIIARDAHWTFNRNPATTESIIGALLTGFLGHIGMKTEDGEYVGPHGLRFWIHPSSPFKKKPPKWIVAAELVETSRLFARGISVISPVWVEKAAGHLVSKQYLDPHWVQSQGRVVASEQVSLYGLVIVPRRAVHFGPIDPTLAREIFIRQALVEGEYESNAPFWQHNQALIQEIEDIEHRTRRQDMLVDDETRYRFYDEKVPADMYQKASFEKWRKRIEQKDPNFLFFTKDMLMRHTGSSTVFDAYPKTLLLEGVNYSLSYWHEPGSFRDGVTLTLPLSYLNQIPSNDWLVPGLLREKVFFICRALPQRYRSQLIPLPGFVDSFVEATFSGQIAPEGSLIEAIRSFAQQNRKIVLPLEAFEQLSLPAHLQMNYKLVDEKGRQLAMSRDLDALRVEYGTETIEQTVDNPFGDQITDRWTFGELPESLVIKTHGNRPKTVYPALTPKEDGVSVGLYDTPEEAMQWHSKGLVRLLTLYLKEQTRYLIKEVSKHPGLCSQFNVIGSLTILQDRIIESVFNTCFLEVPLPRNQAHFEARIQVKRSMLIPIAQDLMKQIMSIMVVYHQVLSALKSLSAFPLAKADIEAQIAALITDGFWLDVPGDALKHYPRYLQAILFRIEKLREDYRRDEQFQREIAGIQARYEKLREYPHLGHQIELNPIRWAIEELRVSLFAQTLKTPYPISIKRIEKMMEQIKR